MQLSSRENKAGVGSLLKPLQAGGPQMAKPVCIKMLIRQMYAAKSAQIPWLCNPIQLAITCFYPVLGQFY